MNNYMIDRMAQNIVDQIPPEKFSFEAVKESLTKFWTNQQAIIWTTNDVLSFANDLNVPMNTELAAEILKSAVQNADADSGLTWDRLESSIYHALTDDFTGFLVDKNQDTYIIRGQRFEGDPGVDLQSYDDPDTVQEVVETLQGIHPVTELENDPFSPISPR